MRQYFTLQTAARIFGSKKFLWFVLGLFVLQAVWIALTGRYPQAFDEQTHFGVTKLFAEQWGPFFAHQPPHAGLYGDVVRNPSFLFYYLLSFPYRLITLFTDNQMLQIILLRFINIALAVAALLAYWKLLRELQLSRAKSNLIIFFVTLLPFVVLMAAQVSYDNLQFLLAGVSLLWAVRLYNEYRKTDILDWFGLSKLFVLGLFACSVKYTFLPLLAGVGIVFLPAIWRTRRDSLRSFAAGFSRLPIAGKLAFITLLAAAIFLFAGGVGLNIIRYNNPEPRCDLVISQAECAQFGPWLRDHGPDSSHFHPTIGQLADYPFVWLQYIVRETVFTIYSNFDGDGVVVYHAKPATLQLLVVGWFWLVACAAILVAAFRQLWRDGTTRLLLIISGLYIGAVFFVNLRGFWHSAYPSAIHSRYLLPVLIPVLGCVVIGFQQFVSGRSARARSTLRAFAGVSVVVTLVLFTQGGGMGTYIVRSSDESFWPDSQLSQRANHDLKSIIDPVILFN